MSAIAMRRGHSCKDRTSMASLTLFQDASPIPIEDKEPEPVAPTSVPTGLVVKSVSGSTFVTL